MANWYACLTTHNITLTSNLINLLVVNLKGFGKMAAGEESNARIPVYTDTHSHTKDLCTDDLGILPSGVPINTLTSNLINFLVPKVYNR